MAQYSKVTNPDGSVYYQDGEQPIAAEAVPDNVKSVLQDAADGSVVDELGDPINPETDVDESEDENLPVNQPDDESDVDQEPVAPAPEVPAAPQVGPDPEQPAEPMQAEIKPAPVPQDSEGMGFPRKDGKTLSIFSNAPHETVKNINGIMAPMTHEEYEEKTDAEIIEKLRKMKKIA